MVVELVDLASDALVPAEAAFDVLPENPADPEVTGIDVHDAAALAVDLPHGTLLERQEIKRAGAPMCDVYVKFNCVTFVQFFQR